MTFLPSTTVTSISGSLPGLAVVLAIDDDADEPVAFTVKVFKTIWVCKVGGPEDLWEATAETGGRVGEGASHLGSSEAAKRAMDDAVAI